ncbi:hypothetical protein FAIPA1_80010 [Frankia sp. AiPs1]|uniref:DUF6294 family protein n=1 Tax=Frankia sp. AiPa1 TaxID=573492 RepID=UPI00202B10D4|nr:DUF6294 family protein [Frankia sp. AiPa1]MCL9760011.1 hypothetical protein [Frankia sp. AiPa1]
MFPLRRMVSAAAVALLLDNNAVQNPRDPHEFIHNLPDHRQPYHWLASGTFPPSLYSRIHRIGLTVHC